MSAGATAARLAFALVGLGLAYGTALFAYGAFLETPPEAGDAAEAYALSQPLMAPLFWCLAAPFAGWCAWAALAWLEGARSREARA